ncbi:MULTISPECIES: hypothetical protein [Streptomyces]|uniref:hypothetical protein n=1 Tax=Streptomyces TaxID=1883 RepID=UPI00117F0109|nr:hypothetical protein [Streptomyces kasugaensis]
MENVLLALGVACAVITVIAIPFIFYFDNVGTAAQRRRRCEEILRSFDGRPEVKVRVSGTGMSAEETALLGHRYGYAVQEWQTRRGQPRYLVLRRTGAPWSPPGYGPGMGNSPPVLGAMPQIRQELSRAPDPRARRRQIGTLVAMGIGSGAAAFSNYRSGGSYTVVAIVSISLLGGAAALAWFTWSATRRRKVPSTPADGPAADAQQPPPSGGGLPPAPNSPPGNGPPGQWPGGGQTWQ